jgi:hypothetical protein
MAIKWRRTVRKIAGERRQVKVRTRAGKEQVRVIGHRNLTDKTARKLGRKRRKGYYSSTDKGKSRKINTLV